MYQSQLGQSPTITKIFSHKEIPSNVLSYLWSRSLRASCRISSWLLFRKVYFPQEENGTYQNTSLGPFPAIQAGNNNQPAPAHSDCCLSWLSSSCCTAWVPPSHPIPSVAHVQRSFCMYQGIIVAQAELGFLPKQWVWVLLVWHSLKFPRKRQELHVTADVGRRNFSSCQHQFLLSYDFVCDSPGHNPWTKQQHLKEVWVE